MRSNETYLITGASGFVGGHLLAHLLKTDPELIIGTCRKPCDNPFGPKVQFESLDLNDQKGISKLILKYKPTKIVHLAAESSVQYSWDHPTKSFNNNVNIFLNVLEAIRLNKHECRILSIGSSECYGIVQKSDLPLDEKTTLNPVSPYAVARVAQELLCKVYTDSYGLDIVLTRSFNHFGPGQDKRFVIPAFVRQVVERKKNNSKEPIKTGNLEIVRDFLDVRDVVRAYSLLLERGKTGEVYNICRGDGFSLKQILDQIGEIAEFPVETRVDPALIRPNDNPVIIGNNKKIREQIGWDEQFSLQETLGEIVSTEIGSTIANPVSIQKRVI